MSTKQSKYTEDEKWVASRRSFIQTLLLSGAAMQMPWLTNCSKERTFNFNTNPFSKEEFRSLSALLETLFPDDGNGPGALTLNADQYVLWVINDEHFDLEERDYILDNFENFESNLKEKEDVRFHELSTSAQIDWVDQERKESNGKKLFSRLLTLIFEALLLDPIYNVNPDGIGWKWLEHDPGLPRPTAEVQYPQILEQHEV